LASSVDWVLLFHRSTNVKILLVLDQAAIVPSDPIKKIIRPVSGPVVAIA